jgi:tetratricopeptide (TPR) repeat protein
LQKAGGDLGAGLTLSLVRKKTGRIIANETIWQKEFDSAITPPKEKDPAPYYRLAEPAAIWTIFHEELPFKQKLDPLGTSDWLSYAYFRAGVRWAREERDDKARKLYVEALNQDADNRSALFNLGALDVEAGEYERAITRLQMARESEPKDPVWYKATYQLAATHHYCSRQKQAENEAETLVATIQETIKIPQITENKRLEDFLKSFKPMACIMCAAILVGTKKTEGPKLQVNITDSDSTEFSYKIITSEGGNVDRTDLYTAKLTYRSHYNLACYYTAASDNEKAWEHLKCALERGGDIVQWAQKDPSLERLREDKNGDFDKWIKKYSTPVTPSGDLRQSIE